MPEQEFAGTQRDTLASFTAAITEIVKTRAALRVAEATIGLLDEDVAGWISRAVDAEAAIAHVQAICEAANMAGLDPTAADIQAAIDQPEGITQ